MKLKCAVAGLEHQAMDPMMYDFITEKMGWDHIWKVSDKPDIILFTGGEDINTKIYGKEPDGAGTPNKKRDGREIYDYFSGQRWNKRPINVGICRGAQLLNCLNGGTLFQHVNNHTRDHKVRLIGTGQEYAVSSTHHQQMVFPDARLLKKNPAILVGVSADAKATVKQGGYGHANKHVDVEIVFYPETRSLCFQPHPEYPGYDTCLDLFKKCFDDYCIKTKGL